MHGRSSVENKKNEQEVTISQHLDLDVDYTSSHLQNKWVYKEP